MAPNEQARKNHDELFPGYVSTLAVTDPEKQGDVMTVPRMTVLVVGATGSIGCLVVEEALRQGHTVRALVRTPGKARRLPPKARVVRGDVTRPDTLSGAVDGVDAVVFTLGSDGAGKVGAESADYGGVRNVLAALGSRDSPHRADDVHRSHQPHRHLQPHH